MLQKIFCYLFLIILLYCKLYCSCVFPGGINDNKCKINIGYSTDRRNVELRNSSTELISVVVDRNIFEYFNRVDKQYNIDVFSNNTYISVLLKPFDKIWYNTSFDIITTQTCKLENRNFLSSLIYGYGGRIGLFYVLFPQTIVTSSIVFKLNVELKYYKFNIFIDENLRRYKVDSNIFLSETSFGLYAAMMVIRNVEIYGGGDIVYRNSSLNDVTNNSSIFGNETFLKFYLANKFYLTKNEVFEFSLEYTPKEEYNISIGYEIGW